MNTQKLKQVITHRVEVDRISYEELQDQLDEMKANQQLILQMLADREVGTVYLDKDCFVSSQVMIQRLDISRSTLERRRKAGEFTSIKVGQQYRYDWCDYLSRAS